MTGCQPPPVTLSPSERFVTLGPDGMAIQSGHGACADDLQTGLTWEIKSDAAGLRDWRNTYSWYNPNEDVNELDYRGLADGGACSNSACDTWSFVAAVNNSGLCDHFDWRMPTRNELMSISDLSRAANPPTAYTEVFPFTQSAEYWTGFDYSTQYESAWAWNFHYGHDRVDWKREAKYVRLVRGESANLDTVKD